MRFICLLFFLTIFNNIYVASSPDVIDNPLSVNGHSIQINEDILANPNSTQEEIKKAKLSLIPLYYYSPNPDYLRVIALCNDVISNYETPYYAPYFMAEMYYHGFGGLERSIDQARIYYQIVVDHQYDDPEPIVGPCDYRIWSRIKLGLSPIPNNENIVPED